MQQSISPANTAWPIGLTVLALGLAALVVAIGAPWQEAPVASALLGLISAIPFVMLVLVAWWIYGRGQAVEAVLIDDQHDVRALARNSAAVRDWLINRRHRVVTDMGLKFAAGPQDASSGDFPLSGYEGGPELAMPKLPRPARALVQAIEPHVVAGDPLSVETVEALVEAHVESTTEVLHRAYDFALKLGFAGTLVGLTVQGYVAQNIAREGIFSQSFLTGMLLKVTATLVGLLVGAYALGLAKHMRTRVDTIVRTCVTWASNALLPAFDPQQRPAIDISATFRATTEEFRETVVDLGDRITAALNTAVANAVRQLREAGAGQMTELGERLNEVFTAPFRSEMSALRSSLAAMQASVQKIAAQLDETSTRIAVEVNKAVREPAALTQRTRQAVDEAAGLVRQLDEASTALATWNDLLRTGAERLTTLPQGGAGGDPESAQQRRRETDEMSELVSEIRLAAKDLAKALNSTTTHLMQIVPLVQPARGPIPQRPVQ